MTVGNHGQFTRLTNTELARGVRRPAAGCDAYDLRRGEGASPIRASHDILAIMARRFRRLHNDPSAGFGAGRHWGPHAFVYV